MKNMINNKKTNIIEIKVPCKLMLTGEWSILEPGNSCISMAINRYVKAQIQPCNEIIINAVDVGIKNLSVEFNDHILKIKNDQKKIPTKAFIFTQKAIETAFNYLQSCNIPLQNFKLTLDSKNTFLTSKKQNYIKLGLGSSAAIVVAIIKAILALHHHNNSDIQTFKLTYLAHYQAQKKIGSGFDIATSAFGTTIHYKRFDPEWLKQKLDSNQTIKNIINQNWPLLHISPFVLPKNLLFCIGFVGNSTSTTNLVSLMKKFKEKKPALYNQLCSKLNLIVEQILHAIKKNNQTQTIHLIKKNRKLLKQLSSESECNLETPELTTLIETANQFQAASKFSGAGGGDCGIAICFDKETQQNIKKAWEKEDILFIDAQPI